MKIIRIESIQNPNTQHLFLRTMEAMRSVNCSGKYYLGDGIIEAKPWGEKVANVLKKALNELKIKFSEVEE